jgi:uncharacterized protein (TIGR02246 family)
MRPLPYLSEKRMLCLLILSVFTLLQCSSEKKEAINALPVDQQKQAITELIDSYVQAREARDTALLSSMLTSEIDQLTSSGNWRYGIEASIQGMLRSSANNPGKRTIQLENIRILGKESAIADTRYEIENADGSVRKMWSTFIVQLEDEKWKIAAIRNMLPAHNN